MKADLVQPDLTNTEFLTCCSVAMLKANPSVRKLLDFIATPSKLVAFCVLVSVILCFMNYSLHVQYKSSSRSHTRLDSGRAALRLGNNISRLLTAPDLLHQVNKTHNVYTKAPPEVDTLFTHDIDGHSQRPTSKIFANSVLSLGEANVGQEAADIEGNVRYWNELQKQTEQEKEMEASLNLTNTTGFVVALRIYEQQTMASGNLMQLQCWAKFLNLAVVKPFTKDSFFSTPLDEVKHPTMLTLNWTFDMEDWRRHTEELGYAPLVSWKYFVHNAPKEVIIVQIKYPTLTHVKNVRSKGLAFPHPPTGEEYKEGCKFKAFTGERVGHFFKIRSFKIVRRVCFNFVTGDELSLKQFNLDILGNYDPGEVTIIIDEWRGIKENQRVLISDDICQEEHAYREYIKPSQQLLTNAEVYNEVFLQDGNDTSSRKDYLAIIARYEMTGLTRSMNKNGDPYAIIPYCLQVTLQAMVDMQKKTGLANTFLSIDIGKYGSSSFVQKRYYNHLYDMELFVSKVYRGKMDVRMWEDTFETIAETTDAGYIAMLQEMIVVNAKCIIFVGGGSFQRHAFHLYSQLHPDEEDQCYEVIEKCTTPYRPIHDR